MCKLGSRRQLDFELDDQGTQVLANLNRLAGTQQDRRPVNKTLNDFLGQLGSEAVADLRTRMIRPLLRGKVFDAARCCGYRLVLLDGSGHLCFQRRHCPHCLEQRHGQGTVYLHQVLEAKLLGPAGLVASLGTAFIDNAERARQAESLNAEQLKQDCELKAFARLAPELKRTFPQLPICWCVDALYACGAFFALAAANDWRFVAVFKPGRLPGLWADFQGLLALCPEQKVEVLLPDGTRQVFRWVNRLSYTDSDNRTWILNALQCEETDKEGKTTTWAWLTNLPVTRQTVPAIAGAGRGRWCIESQGFNMQESSELNLAHAYSHGEEQLRAFYYLLQIGHLILQLLEKGSLLRQLAAEQGKTPLQLFGSLKNMARRLLESLRNLSWPEACFSEAAAQTIQVRLDSS